jgi:hypothetical protein
MIEDACAQEHDRATLIREYVTGGMFAKELRRISRPSEIGVSSMVTPPVALASFAAANIAGTNPWTTSVESMKIAWPTYIVPFLFIFTPGPRS